MFNVCPKARVEPLRALSRLTGSHWYQRACGYSLSSSCNCRASVGDGDLAARAVGRARLSASWRFARGFVEAEVFRYRPVFDLTTIWGAFAPEGHYGVAASGEAAVGRGVRVGGEVTHRRYQPTTDVTPFLVGVGNQTTTLALGGRWAGDVVDVDARYRLLTGFGGAQSGGDLRVGYGRADARWHAGLRLTAFQEEEQFRVADGTWCDNPRIKTDAYEVRVARLPMKRANARMAASL